MTAAISCAEQGMRAIMVSPFMSERSQSVMAEGGINAALDNMGEGDSVELHIEDTLKGGSMLAGEQAVRGLCESAPDIVRWLEKLGTVFSLKDDGSLDQRAFGGQSCRRTCYAGTSTGKQIVSALIMEARRYEARGLIERRLWNDFHSGLIKDGRCYGALIYDESTAQLEPVYADAVIMATGGQNALFGKTTGSTQCDGYAAGRLFMQGAALKNLEFIQFHPTTLDTGQKRMLVSEAARGEGGRLYYYEDESGDAAGDADGGDAVGDAGKGRRRVYFMEEKFGPKGNLMPRDVVSRCEYETGRQVYLDVSFLGDVIDRRIPEIRDICMKYRGIDIHKESIPVAPGIHFFMGGLAVDADHMTNIDGLYAVGECASRYHGANRLGGNSLLAAVYSGRTAARAIARKAEAEGKADAAQIADIANDPELLEYIGSERDKLFGLFGSESRFPVMYLRDMAAETMNRSLGIVRDEESLDRGIEDISYYIDLAGKIRYDRSVLAYFNYSVRAILVLAKATLICARERRESRGAHFRSDYPGTSDDMRAATIISYDDGAYNVSLDKEGRYES